MSGDYLAGYPWPSTDSPAVGAGKEWVKKTLLEAARGRNALIWWWQVPHQGSGGLLYLLGDVEREPISEQFSDRLLRDCTRAESARLEIRRCLEVLVENLTVIPRGSSRFEP